MEKWINRLISEINETVLSIISKLNILKSQIGQLNSLTTNDKTSLVVAVNEVNNIQIGGRNLILNSKSLEGRTDSYGGLTTAVMPLSVKLEKDKEYIFTYKNNNDIPRAEINTITLRNSNGETIQKIQTIGDGSETIFKVNIDGVVGIAFYSVWKNAFFSFRELMLTSGNKIVDWTPAPEDQVSDWNETDSTKHSFIKNKPTIPTVNNGQLTLSTGTGLSGSANFTANQAGESTFSVAVTNTHKLPTITEWNAALANTTYTAGNGLTLSGTAFSVNYGTSAGTAAQGDDARINNGQTAFNSLGNYVLRTNLNNRLGLLSSVTGGSDFYYSPSTDPDKPTGVQDGTFMSMSFDSDNWYTQLYADWRNNEWYVRSKNSGTWNSFQKLIHTGNISSELSGYVPTSRTITINGVTQNLSANRTWAVADTITRLRGTESGTYTSGDLTLLAGANTAITQSGANITIASTNTITAQAFYESSLRKYKTNIKPYEESALEVIKNIEIVTFDRTDSDIKNKIGVIADDSPSEILNEELDAVDLYKTVFVLAKSIQELNAKIKELEKQK